MIKSEYNPETGEATATITGTSTIVRAELIALRKVITSDPSIFKMWIDAINDQLQELAESDPEETEETEEEEKE